MKQEEQTLKIRDLLLSQDKAMVELGLQLIDLGKRNYLIEDFDKNDIIIQESSITGIGDDSQEFSRKYLRCLESFLDKIEEESATKRKVFNVMAEVFSQFTKVQDKTSKVILKAICYNQKYLVSSESIYSKKEIKKIIVFLNRFNNLTKEEIKNRYKTTLSSRPNLLTPPDSFLDWISFRTRNWKNPIEYEVQAFDKNYHFFKIQVTIDRKKCKSE